MLATLIVPTSTTIFLYFYLKYIKKEQRNYFFNIKFFVVIFLIQVMFYAIKLYADESPWNYIDRQNELSENTKMRIEEELALFPNLNCLTDTDRTNFQKQHEFHLKGIIRSFNRIFN